MFVLWLTGSALAAGCGPDQASLQTILKHVNRRGVDYERLAGSGRPALAAYSASVAEADMRACSEAEQKAFYINAYNVLTLEVVAGAWPLESIMDLDGGKVWDTRTFTVAGESLTLNQIEHVKLRPLGDPRIHSALNCASIGCAPLSPTPFVPGRLDAQLDEATRTWASTNAFVRDKGTVGVHRVFEWFSDDFPAPSRDIPGVEGPQERALVWIAGFLDPGRAAALLAGGYSTHWTDYNWGINSQ
jgi:hypothetical protein